MTSETTDFARLCAAFCIFLACFGCAGELDNPEAFRAARAEDEADAGSTSSEDVSIDAPEDADPQGDVTTDAESEEVCEPLGQTAPELLEARCATPFCHSTQTQSANLDLEAPNIAERLVDVAAPGCPDAVLVSSTDPAGQSYLLEKLLPDPTCASQMPLADTPLNSDEVQCLTDWVTRLVASPNTGE